MVVKIVVFLWKEVDIIVKVCQFEDVELKCMIFEKMLIIFFNFGGN